MNDVNEEPKIMFVRLNNGDDIVAEVVEVGDENQIDYMLFNPLKVVYIPSDKGAAYLQVAFMPWVFTRICSEQEFLIHAEDVVTMANVSNYMEEYYWKNMDFFLSKDDKEEIVEPETEGESPIDEEGLQEILQALKTTRTYH